MESDSSALEDVVKRFMDNIKNQPAPHWQSQLILDIVLHHLRPDPQISFPNVCKYSDNGERENQKLANDFWCLQAVTTSIAVSFSIQQIQNRWNTHIWPRLLNLCNRFALEAENPPRCSIITRFQAFSCACKLIHTVTQNPTLFSSLGNLVELKELRARLLTEYIDNFAHITDHAQSQSLIHSSFGNFFSELLDVYAQLCPRLASGTIRFLLAHNRRNRLTKEVYGQLVFILIATCTVFMNRFHNQELRNPENYSSLANNPDFLRACLKMLYLCATQKTYYSRSEDGLEKIPVSYTKRVNLSIFIMIANTCTNLGRTTLLRDLIRNHFLQRTLLLLIHWSESADPEELDMSLHQVLVGFLTFLRPFTVHYSVLDAIVHAFRTMSKEGAYQLREDCTSAWKWTNLFCPWLEFREFIVTLRQPALERYKLENFSGGTLLCSNAKVRVQLDQPPVSFIVQCTVHKHNLKKDFKMQ
jgi:hypothetical protein